MKLLDSITSKPPSFARPGTPFKGNPSFYYFYKSLQLVLTFWIVTLLVVVLQPWLNYYVQSMIFEPQSQVLGESSNLKDEAVRGLSDQANPAAAVFVLKNEKLEINAPVVEGIVEESLKKGIGHHPESVWPSVKGNVVLAGHNTDLDSTNPYAKVFFRLREVAIGDEVKINYLGKTYIYQVIKSQVVKAKDTSLFEPIDDWILTFYTCDPPYTDWKRLVFQAKLMKIE